MAKALPRDLRGAMPFTASVIDAFRTAFGREEIDAMIKRGLSGQPGFWAKEGDWEIGTKTFDAGTCISGDALVVDSPVIKGRRK